MWIHYILIKNVCPLNECILFQYCRFVHYYYTSVFGLETKLYWNIKKPIIISLFADGKLAIELFCCIEISGSFSWARRFEIFIEYLATSFGKFVTNNWHWEMKREIFVWRLGILEIGMYNLFLYLILGGNYLIKKYWEGYHRGQDFLAI